MKRIIAGIILCLLAGCVVTPHDNQGLKTGDIGLHNEVPVTTTAGRDLTARLIESSGGGVGLTIVSVLAVLGMARSLNNLTRRRGL